MSKLKEHLALSERLLERAEIATNILQINMDLILKVYIA